MVIDRQTIEQMDRIKRLNLINSIPGIKSANLIGTRNKSGQLNLAIFSSVIHLGSNPALLGFIARPHKDVRRHTIENILETGYYTINHVAKSFIKNAHYTSTKFPEDISEFDACGLTPEFKQGFWAPFVKESPLQIGLSLAEQIPIQVNDTRLIIGQVEFLIFPEEKSDENGLLDLDQLDTVGIGGLNAYYDLQKLDEFPYARLEDTPNFTNTN